MLTIKRSEHVAYISAILTDRTESILGALSLLKNALENEPPLPPGGFDYAMERAVDTRIKTTAASMVSLAERYQRLAAELLTLRLDC